MKPSSTRSRRRAIRALVGTVLAAVLAAALPAATALPPQETPALPKFPVTGPGGAYNGPGTCRTSTEDGMVRAVKPGDCAQFGTVGQQRTDARARNVILIIGDGMGQQEITAARNYLKGGTGRFEGLDNFTSTGAYTHHSVNWDGTFNYLTDSAASATAWATGIKTYNGAVGLDLQLQPVENLLEKAKRAGMRTGNVTTAEIEDATPASMIAHAVNRKCYGPEEDKNSGSCRGDFFAAQDRMNGELGSIAEQLVDTRPDVALGGGLKPFQQTVSHEGKGRSAFLDPDTVWTAGATVLENAEANGFNVVKTADELNAVTVANQDDPVLGLFADGNMTTRFVSTPATADGGAEAPRECVLQDTGDEPELVDMTEKAIELLDDPTADKGFFLQVESASVDKRAHAADSCGMIGEVERLDETVKAAIDFARNDGDTLVVVTADHAQASEVIYDGATTVAQTTRLRTREGASETIAFGTVPRQMLEQNPGISQTHTGSQLRIAAFGPGEENVIGQTDQTDLFFTIANALDINDIPRIEPSVPTPPSATTYDAGTAARNNPADTTATCYQVGDRGFVSGPGDCAQFGKTGQGLDDSAAKNVILFIGDGMGDSEITSARNYLHGGSGRLPGIDALPYTGYYTTFALDREKGGPAYVTDSAASATGWATGTKTYNGALGVQVDGTPVPNLIELAKVQGMKTGNVTTAEIQDATPAALGSHALNRKCYGPEADKNAGSCRGDEFDGQFRENGGLGSISEQLIDTRADVTLGGGAKYLDQQVQVDGRFDDHVWRKDTSVLDNARQQGFQIVENASALQTLTEADQEHPVLGLFAPGNMPRIWSRTTPTVEPAVGEGIRCEENPERDAEVPSLAQMTTKALDLLQNENGFLLQVESASIDKADHAADACGQIGEVQQLDEAIQAAREWVAATGEPTLIVATADHAHTSQISTVGQPTAGRTSKLITADGDEMAVSYANAASNDDDVALGGQGHTGAQLRIAAEGPGAANVVGQTDQTDMHYLIANALGLYRGDPQISFEGRWKDGFGDTDTDTTQDPAPTSTMTSSTSTPEPEPSGSAGSPLAGVASILAVLALIAGPIAWLIHQLLGGRFPSPPAMS